MCKVNSNYILFNKYFHGSISDENMNIFLGFIDSASVFMDRGMQTVNWKSISSEYSEIIKAINRDVLQLLFYNYVFDFDYDSRRIFVYGQVEREEDIGLIMLGIIKIANILKKKEKMLTLDSRNGGNYGE